MMVEQSRWVRHRMICPEGMGETELLLEWHGEGEGLKGISCKNPLLRELGGAECQWSCWEKIVLEKPK